MTAFVSPCCTTYSKNRCQGTRRQDAGRAALVEAPRNRPAPPWQAAPETAHLWLLSADLILQNLRLTLASARGQHRLARLGIAEWVLRVACRRGAGSAQQQSHTLGRSVRSSSARFLARQVSMRVYRLCIISCRAMRARMPWRWRNRVPSVAA